MQRAKLWAQSWGLGNWEGDQLFLSYVPWGAFPFFSQKGPGAVLAQETAFPKFQKCFGYEREKILKS